MREKVFNPDDTRSGRLRIAQSLGSDLHQNATENVIDSFEVVSPLPPVVETAGKADGNEAVADFDEVSASDHATTGSETESDIDTTVRPKVSFKDIQAPDGNYLHQHAKLKTLHLMKSENGRVFLCGRTTNC